MVCSEELTLNHVNNSSLQESLSRRRDSSTTIEHKSQPSSSLHLDLLKDHSIRQSSKEGDMVALCSLFGTDSPVEDRFLESTRLVDLGQDTLSDKFPNGRDTNHDTLLVS
jgi:hypothetical protein